MVHKFSILLLLQYIFFLLAWQASTNIYGAGECRDLMRYGVKAIFLVNLKNKNVILSTQSAVHPEKKILDEILGFCFIEKNILEKSLPKEKNYLNEFFDGLMEVEDPPPHENFQIYIYLHFSF